MLGLRSRNQNVGTDDKLPPIEFLPLRDVLRGFALHPLMQEAAVVDPAELAQFLFGMGVQVDAVASDGVAQKNFRGQARSRDSGVLQKLSALEERRVQRHSRSFLFIR